MPVFEPDLYGDAAGPTSDIQNAVAAYLECDYERAHFLAEQGLAILNAGQRDGRSNVDTNIALYVLGRVALCTEDYASARLWLEKAVTLWRATGDMRSAPGALVGLSCVALAEGDKEEACQLLAESLALSEEGSWRMATLYALEGAAILAAAKEQPHQALRLAGAASSLRSAWEYPLPPAEDAVLRRWLAPVRRVLGRDLCASTWLAGKNLSAVEALECARAVVR